MALINFKRAAAANPGAVDTGSPERTVLRNAIEARNRAQADVEASRAAAERASEMVEQARSQLEAAKQGLETAKVSASSRLAEAALRGTVIGGDATMSAARQTEQNSADSLEAARGALSQVEEAIVEAERELERAETKVKEAVKVVVASIVPALVVEAARVKAAWAGQRAVLKLVQDQNPERPIDRTGRDWRDVVAAKPNPITELLSEPLVDEEAIAPWKAWLEALKVDAAAPAPL